MPAVLDPEAGSFQSFGSIVELMRSIDRRVIRHAPSHDGRHMAAWRAHTLLGHDEMRFASDGPSVG